MSAVPTKRLFDPNRKTQLAYVPANSTDISVTWARWRAESAKSKPEQPEKQIRRVR